MVDLFEKFNFDFLIEERANQIQPTILKWECLFTEDLKGCIRNKKREISTHLIKSKLIY